MSRRQQKKLAILKERVKINKARLGDAFTFMFETTILPTFMLALGVTSLFIIAAYYFVRYALPILFYQSIGNTEAANARYNYLVDIMNKKAERFMGYANFLSYENLQKLSAKQVMAGVILGAAILYFNVLVTIPYIIRHRNNKVLFSIVAEGLAELLHVKAIVVDAPLWEEIAFRGVLLNWFRVKFIQTYLCLSACAQMMKSAVLFVANTCKAMACGQQDIDTTEEILVTPDLEAQDADVVEDDKTTTFDYVEQALAVGASTLLFSLAHLPYIQRRCTFVGGLAMGAAYQLSNDDTKAEDSLDSNVSVHFTNNALATVASYVPIFG